MFVLLLIHFLTGFFLMNNLLIPPKHAFPILRLLLWFGFGNIAFREGYEDITTWGTAKRKDHPVEGRHRWLTVGILCTETLLCFKYRKDTGNILNNPTPLWVSIPWALFFISITVTWLYLRFKPDRTRKYPPELDFKSSKTNAIEGSKNAKGQKP